MSTDFFDKGTKEQYEALGRFVEAFESMVNEVREICIEHISRDDDGRHLADVALHHEVLTAKPLFDIMRAVIAEMVNSPENKHHFERDLFQSVLGTIQNEYADIVHMRNALLHGVWLTGVVEYDGSPAKEFFISKFRTTKRGLEENDVPASTAELKELAQRCIDVQSWIGLVNHCLNWAFARLSDHFKVENKITWRLQGTSQTTLPQK